jgi:hypothetical protein
MAVGHDFPVTISLPAPSADRLPMAPEVRPSLYLATDPRQSLLQAHRGGAVLSSRKEMTRSPGMPDGVK